MKKEKALEKLRKAKVEAVSNSTVIEVGRLELNEAIKALRIIIALCIKGRLRLKRRFTVKIGENRMEERIESIKNKIDDYLQNANNESDCCKKEGWIDLAARWEQYLKEISGIEYRKEECGLSSI